MVMGEGLVSYSSSEFVMRLRPADSCEEGQAAPLLLLRLLLLLLVCRGFEWTRRRLPQVSGGGESPRCVITLPTNQPSAVKKQAAETGAP